MPEIKREFNNFLPGELTYHEAVEGGEYTAQLMQNLRADTNGALRQRHGIFARSPETHPTLKITGIAASQKHLLFIRNDGQLFYRRKSRLNPVDTFIYITGRRRDADGIKLPTGLSGRLSLIEEFAEFYIITSEGTDQGLWIDVRDADNIEAHPLGFDPPEFEATAEGRRGLTNRLSPQHYHFYRFTYLRDAKGEPFGDMESNPSPALLADFTSSALSAFFRLHGLQYLSDDGLETGIGIYRSRPIEPRHVEPLGIVTLEDKDLDYRQVGIFNFRDRPDVTAFDDTMAEEERQEQVALRFDNDRMPSTVKSFTLFNDIVWCPNADELRYSDVRFEGLALWAFPKDNSIRRPVETQFATPYRNMLLWGGRNGLWRLTGGTEYDFQIDRISNLGAIDGYAHTTTEDVMGYITPAGLHFTDGIATTDISDPIDAHFENREPVRGSVAFLPNATSVWSVVFKELDGTLSRKTFVRAKQWVQWDGIEAEQSARFEALEITGDKITQVLIVENTPFIREILWENTTQTRDGSTDTERDFIKWAWKSQRLDWEAQGIATKKKRFTELAILGKADSVRETTEPLTETQITQLPVEAIFTIHDAHGNTSELTKEVILDRTFLHPVRIPINKRGIAIEFEIRGQGNCDIRSLSLKGNI